MIKALVLLPALLCSACIVQRAPRFQRPARSLPTDIAIRYQLPGEVLELDLAPIHGAGEDHIIHYGHLACGPEIATVHLIRPKGVENPPFVLLLPILAGGRALMWFIADGLAERGFAVGWTRRVGSALAHGQQAEDLETLFRRTVIQNRMLLAWARDGGMIDRDRCGVLGLSMGGLLGNAILATEPCLRGGVLCLAGGNLPDLLANSSERRVRRWRAWRAQEDGIAGLALREEIFRESASDPILLGPYVPTAKVLMFAARYDTVVPWPQQQALWEALGRPHRIVVPLGHYTAILVLGSVLEETAAFLTKRFVSEN